MGTPQDLNDQVDHIASLDQALLDLLFLHFPGKEGGVLPGSCLELEIHAGLQDRLKSHDLRLAVTDSQHIDAKGILQTGFLVKQVGEVLHIRILFQLNDNTNALLGGLVGNIHDICGLFGLCKACHIRKKFGNIGADHGIGDFCYHKVSPAALCLFIFHLASQLYFAYSGFIDIEKLIFVDHNAAGGKVRSLDVSSLVERVSSNI